MNVSKKAEVKSGDKSEVRDLETHLVFLDTQVYRKYHFNPSNKLLRIIIDLVQKRKIELYITDITLAEIRRQIEELFAEVAQASRKANKDLNYWRRRAGLPEIESEIEKISETLPNETFERFVRFFRLRVRNHILDASSVGAKSVFESYFAKRPPFERAGSKEFPDAFVIKCLDDWCNENHAQMNVVSGDRSFRNAAEATKNLISFETLEQFLEALAEVENHDSLSYAQKFLSASTNYDDLKARLQVEINNAGLVYDGDLNDGEANEAEIIDDIEIEEYRLLSYGRHLSFLIKIKAKLDVNVSYDDMSGAIYDKEDDKYFGVEIESTNVECETTVDCYVRFEDASGTIDEFELIDSDVRLHDLTDFD